MSLLVGVADHGSIAAAAAAAECTPSSASEQLSKLERELGVDLLERSPRSVRLTSAGAELVEHARRILAQIDAAEQAVEEVAGLSTGRLRVASYHTGATRYVVPSIAAFLRLHPHVRVNFDEMEPEVAVPAVQSGAIDIALVHRYIGLQAPDTVGLDVVDVRTDALILAVPDRLAVTAGSVSLLEFVDAPWISTRLGEGFQAITELAAARLGFAPTIVARADSYGLVLDLVAAGLGVALVPTSAMVPRLALEAYAVHEPANLGRQESIITRSADRAPGTREMRNLITERFRRVA
ncbi:LysR family transcriptional regulator [Agromyces sp. NPDC049794]|uniref:LysR family transcriptional regulator n=1 Tax=unclassified Agromyces TaxID=2639701 RepID=UPI003402B96A